ncbi:MAG: VWA domain-containing protein [Gammaproteobacteria bacterium]|nr:VWA domain-containing protein [Gammaproteobacteria bacterium]
MNDLFNLSMQQVISEVMAIQNNLHFIRADWFYAFIPLFLFLYLSYKTRLNNKNWQGVIDRQLLPFVLCKTGNKQRRYPLLLIFIACSLCITALAGPVYKKLSQPVYREQSSLVVLLDLSQSMNATDIKPSRLSRAKLELLDLLKTRKTGQTALIVYAADAFVVTPLTDDNATIANLVPSLETDMMPAQGSNLSKALARTFSLFTQAGIINGDILVITDDIHAREESAIKKVFSQGHRLSIFGMGTSEGAPVPLDGGFLQNSKGAIVIPRLHPEKLQTYALRGGGLYTSLQVDDRDIEKLSNLFQSSDVAKDITNKNLNADIWQEEGHWLLLPLIFFAALWARKGWLAIQLLFLFPVVGLIPQPAYAESPVTTDNDQTTKVFDTKYLWSSPDQQAMKAFNSGDNKKAAENFTRPEWKASALYRNEDYEATVKTLKNTNSSNGYYNKGNALAKLGKFEESIKAYDKALELNELNEDATFNRKQVKQALKQQQQDNQQQDGQPQDDKQQGGEKQQDEQSQDSQKQDNQQQDSQQSDKQSSDPSKDNSNKEDDKDQEQQPSPESDSKEQQEMEQEQLKQRDAKAEAEQQKQEDQQYQQDQKKNQQDDTQQQNAEKEVEHKDSDEKPMDIEVNPLEASITEEEKATEQWLKRIPDDPGGLLRRKFYYQYQQIPNQQDSEEPW